MAAQRRCRQRGSECANISLDSDFSAKEVSLWALYRNPRALPWGATLVFIYIAKFIIPRDESSSSLLGVLDSLDPLGTRRRGELWLGTPVTWPRGLKIPESVSVVSVITHSSRETSKLDKIEDWQDKEPFEWRLKFSIVMKFQVSRIFSVTSKVLESAFLIIIFK